MFQTWNDLILVDLEDCGTLETKSPSLKLEKEKKISEKHFFSRRLFRARLEKTFHERTERVCRRPTCH